MGACSFGMGLSSLILNVTEAVFIAAGGSDETDERKYIETNIYYAIAGFILVVTAALYFVERDSPFALYYCQETNQEKDVFDNEVSCMQTAKSNWEGCKIAWSQTWPYLFQIGFCLMISLTTFPAVVADVRLSFLESKEWTSLGIITLWNLCDTIGRYSGGV